MPPIYWSTFIQYPAAFLSKGALSERGEQYRRKYHDESTKVSIVSVSRRAFPPHVGQAVSRKAGDSPSGDSPLPVNATSMGRRTGRSFSGTGTVPQESQ